MALARAALALLDLRQHAASHPRLGTVDHISVQPAGHMATLDAAADVARAIGVLLKGRLSRRWTDGRVECQDDGGGRGNEVGG